MSNFILFLIFIGWYISWGIALLSPVGLIVAGLQCARHYYVKDESELEQYYSDCKVELYLALCAFIFAVICFVFDFPIASETLLTYNAVIFTAILLLIGTAYYKIYPNVIDARNNSDPVTCGEDTGAIETDEEETSKDKPKAKSSLDSTKEAEEAERAINDDLAKENNGDNTD